MRRWPEAAPLGSERLVLAPLRRDHARAMAAVLADPVLYTHAGGSPPSRAELQARYARQARGRSPGGGEGWLNWVLRRRDEDRLSGFVQATVRERDGVLEAELAWLVGVRDQGAALAAEAAGAAIAWLATQRVARHVAHVHPDNEVSATVARRLGFTPTSRVRDGEVRWEARARVEP